VAAPFVGECAGEPCDTSAGEHRPGAVGGGDFDRRRGDDVAVEIIESKDLDFDRGYNGRRYGTGGDLRYGAAGEQDGDRENQ
jgi:hypothetical protein